MSFHILNEQINSVAYQIKIFSSSGSRLNEQINSVAWSDYRRIHIYSTHTCYDIKFIIILPAKANDLVSCTLSHDLCSLLYPCISALLKFQEHWIGWREAITFTPSYKPSFDFWRKRNVRLPSVISHPHGSIIKISKASSNQNLWVVT